MKALLSYFLLSSTLMSCVWSVQRRAQPIAIEPIHQNILLLDPPLSRFAEDGPLVVQSRYNRELPLNLDESIVLDHFAPIIQDKAPLVVISHGNFSAKAAHREQGARLSSWGFHVLSVEFPNRDQWLENGRRLHRLIDLLHRSPDLLGTTVDSEKIIVVGHSFGGSASILAMADGAPVLGAILLDPAVVHSRVTKAMRKVVSPVVLLGSDQRLFMARGRKNFFKNIRSEMLEVTVPGAVHDDAQGPSMFSRSSLGVDPFTSRDHQRYFRAMLAAAVIGLSSSGTLDFPSRIFDRERSQGRLAGFSYRDKFSTFR